MFWIHLLLLPVFLLLIPQPTPDIPPGDTLAAACRVTVDGLAGLTADLQLPEHLLQPDAVKTDADFDVNAYLTVLDHLSMRPGYVLDYVYQYDGLGGFPVIYARQADAPAYQTLADYHAQHSGEAAATAFMEYIEPDGTAESYLQLAVLRVMAGQFYLYWHANYNDRMIVCDGVSLETLLTQPNTFGSAIPEDVQQAARDLDTTPRFEVGRDSVKVELLTFTKWGGFGRLTYKISQDAPHRFIMDDVEALVPYHCGVVF